MKNIRKEANSIHIISVDWGWSDKLLIWEVSRAKTMLANKPADRIITRNMIRLF